MSKTREVYLLSPKSLSPEVIAVAFAKTSRSPDSFRDIALQLTDEKSAEFHEKWVVGYGHASVAEHAVLHIAIENVSRLAVECIESNRLASYTEKSTRYQIFDRDAFYTPANIAESPHADLYRDTMHALFDAYFDSIEPVQQAIREKYPRKDDESEKRYAARIRSKWIDNCRFLLPSATLANLGMTANARVLEHAIAKMLSHPLQEVRDAGDEVKRVALAEVPTLVKYAERSEYLSRVEIGDWKLEVGEDKRQMSIANPKSVELIDYDREAEVKFVATCMYRSGGCGYEDALAYAREMSSGDRVQMIDHSLASRGPYEAPLRELEHVTYMFDCVMDNGAYFDVKRHRMMTQTPQALTVDLGYAIPQAIEAAGVRDRYCRVLDQSIEAYRRIACDFPHEASYVVANAFNRRVLLSMNLRELFHFCRLRGGPAGHFSYRRIAMQMYESVRKVHPAFAAHMRCEEYPSAEAIEQEYFVK